MTASEAEFRPGLSGGGAPALRRQILGDEVMSPDQIFPKAERNCPFRFPYIWTPPLPAWVSATGASGDSPAALPPRPADGFRFWFVAMVY